MIGLLALALVGVPYPSPPADEPPPILPAGECSIEGVSPPPVDPDDEYSLTVFVRCGITDETSRVFVLPLDVVDIEVLVRYGQLVEDTESDEPKVH